MRKTATALQSLTSKKVGLTLSSLPPLSRFATFSAIPNLYGEGVSGFPLRVFWVLPPFWFPSTKRLAPLPELFRITASVTAL